MRSIAQRLLSVCKLFLFAGESNLSVGFPTGSLTCTAQIRPSEN